MYALSLFLTRQDETDLLESAPRIELRTIVGLAGKLESQKDYRALRAYFVLEAGTSSHLVMTGQTEALGGPPSLDTSPFERSPDSRLHTAPSLK